MVAESALREAGAKLAAMRGTAQETATLSDNPGDDPRIVRHFIEPGPSEATTARYAGPRSGPSAYPAGANDTAAGSRRAERRLPFLAWPHGRPRHLPIDVLAPR